MQLKKLKMIYYKRIEFYYKNKKTQTGILSKILNYITQNIQLLLLLIFEVIWSIFLKSYFRNKVLSGICIEIENIIFEYYAKQNGDRKVLINLRDYVKNLYLEVSIYYEKNSFVYRFHAKRWRKPSDGKSC